MIHQFATRVTPITNHQFYIQAALILAVMAARRLVTLAFVAFAVFNITFPWVMSSIAHRMGVGRGTDFLLYALVIAFLAQILSSFRRNSARERQITHLARRIALDNAPEPPAGARLTAETDD